MKKQNNKNLKLKNKLKDLERENDILKATLNFFESCFDLINTLNKFDNVDVDIDFDLKF